MIASPERCSHGKRRKEPCDECTIISLRTSLAWMEPAVEKKRTELKELLRRQHAALRPPDSAFSTQENKR